MNPENPTVTQKPIQFPTIQIPKVWTTFLEIEDFAQLPTYPTKYYPQTDEEVKNHIVDPNPYRDDSREICIQHGCFLVILGLTSGSSNYWLNWLVYRKEENDPNFDNAIPVYEFGEPFFDLPSTDQLTLSTGEVLSLKLDHP